MNAFVTGATGFLGSHLCNHLIEGGWQVSALYRSENKKNDLPLKLQNEINWIKGDLFSKDWSLEKYDVVFHLAGYVGYKPEDHSIMQKVNVEGTKEVLKKIKEAKYTPKLIYVSSVVAVGAGLSSKDILNEDSVYNVEQYNFGYFDTKHEAEKIVFNEVSSSDLHAVALNPSTIYGPGDMNKGSRKAQLKVAKGQLKFYPQGGVSIIHVDDVCKAILSAVENGKSGERYILSGENITIGRLFEIIAECSGAPNSFKALPKPLLLGLGYCCEFMKKIGIQTSISLENLRVATMYHWFDNKKAKKELGLNPLPAKQAIKESIEWAKIQKLI